MLYLLHGIGGNESHWTPFGVADVILDNLIAADKAVPMIVVMPNGRASNEPSTIFGGRGGPGAGRQGAPAGPTPQSAPDGTRAGGPAGAAPARPPLGPKTIAGSFDARPLGITMIMGTALLAAIRLSRITSATPNCVQ